MRARVFQGQAELGPFQALKLRTYCSVFVHKRGKSVLFCETVHTDPQQNGTKTEVLENAVQSGYSQTQRFLKTFCINANAKKLEACENGQIFTKPEQCERTNTDILAPYL